MTPLAIAHLELYWRTVILAIFAGSALAAGITLAIRLHRTHP